MKIKFLGQNLFLDSEAALFWEEKKLLIVSDLHYGKAGHFRKNGIAVTSEIHQTDLQRIKRLIHKYNAEGLLFLGDLFHSKYNNEWESLNNFLVSLGIPLILVRGNHDILPAQTYSNFEVVDQYTLDPFIFSHDPEPAEDSRFYRLAGHIHPAIHMRVGPRQSRRLKCFYFGKKYALVPSFGVFTGNYIINYDLSSDNVYVIAESKVFDLKNFK